MDNFSPLFILSAKFLLRNKIYHRLVYSVSTSASTSGFTYYLTAVQSTILSLADNSFIQQNDLHQLLYQLTLASIMRCKCPLNRRFYWELHMDLLMFQLDFQKCSWRFICSFNIFIWRKLYSFAENSSPLKLAAGFYSSVLFAAGASDSLFFGDIILFFKLLVCSANSCRFPCC